MSDNIKNEFSLYVNSKEKIQEALRREKTRRKMRLILLVVFLIVIFCIFLVYRYRSYNEKTIQKTVNEIATNSARTFDYQSGTIAYDEDGVTYFDESGEEVWKKSISIKNPIANYCGDYIVIANKNGNEIVLLEESGKSKSFQIGYSIHDVEVSEQGVVAALSENNGDYFIELYDSTQKKLVSIKTMPEKSGYALDIALSSDGESLMASYLQVEGMSSKCKIVFYNFGEEGQDKKDKIVGEFEYEDTIIPKVAFLNNRKACAIGDNQLNIFNSKNTPTHKKTVTMEDTIESIAIQNSKIAIVTEKKKANQGNQHTISLYSSSGREIMSKEVSTTFNSMQLGKNEILLVDNYKYSILAFSGKVVYEGNTKKRIFYMSPTGKSRNYLITYEDKMEFIRLQ